MAPAAQRDPSALGRPNAADVFANLSSRRAVRQPGDCEPHRSRAEVPPRCDAPRQHRDHRPTNTAAEPPHAHHDEPRGPACTQRAAHLTLTHSVAHDVQACSQRPRRHPASRALRGAYPRRRRRRLHPKLDVEIRMNDMTGAPSFQQDNSGARRGAATPRHLFCGRNFSMLRLRGVLATPSSVKRPNPRP